MKKSLLFTMGAMAVLSLIACGDKESDDPQQQDKDTRKEAGQLCTGDADCKTDLVCVKNAIGKDVCMDKNLNITEFCYWTFEGEGAVKDVDSVTVCAPKTVFDGEAVVTCHGSGHSETICSSSSKSCGQLPDSSYACICNPGYEFVKLDKGSSACRDVAEDFCEDDANTELSACITSNNGLQDYVISVVCENKDVKDTAVCENGCEMVDGVATCK